MDGKNGKETKRYCKISNCDTVIYINDRVTEKSFE